MMRKQFDASQAGRYGLALCITLVSLTCWVRSASAGDDDIVNAKGFEPNPPYGFSTTFLTTGQLEGQINPVGSGQVISPGQWLRTRGMGTSTATVQSAVFAP